MGKVRQLTGAKGQRESAREAGKQQQVMGEAAIAQQEDALKRVLGIQAPFTQAGQEAMSGLLSEVLGGAPSPSSMGRFTGFNRRAPGVAIRGREELGPDIDTGFEFDVSPERVTESPFFQELARDQEQRLMGSAAARGKLGSGGTDLALNRNLLQLGQQFQQQDIANQIQEAKIQQALRAEKAGLQAQRFGQLFNVGQLGANVATGSGSAIQGAASNIGNLLTGIGNVQASTTLQRGNILAQSRQDMLSNFGSGGLPSAMTGGAVDIGRFMGGMTGGQGGSTQGLMSMFSASDRRLKTDIKHIGQGVDGLNVYEFKYKSDPETTYAGYLAQEVEKHDPNQVITAPDGMLWVSNKYQPLKVA
jgi:hypothetical protein